MVCHFPRQIQETQSERLARFSRDHLSSRLQRQHLQHAQRQALLVRRGLLRPREPVRLHDLARLLQSLRLTEIRIRFKSQESFVGVANRLAHATSPIRVDPLFLCATGGHGTYRSSGAAAKLEGLGLEVIFELVPQVPTSLLKDPTWTGACQSWRKVFGIVTC